MTIPAIIQLQQDATDGKHDVSDLLGKALLIATKLKLSDANKWISNELTGYKNDNIPLPPYRIIPCELRVINPYQGLIPFSLIRDSTDVMKLDEECHKIYIRDPVSSLIDIVLENKDKIIFNFPSSVEELLMRMQVGGTPLRPVRVVAPYLITSIISTVRARVLEWVLTLEEKGITGEGLSFPSPEKKITENSQFMHIENFQGILGDVHHSTVTQTNNLVVNSGDFSSLARHLRSQGVTEQDIVELELAVKTDPVPGADKKFGAKVSGWVGGMVAKAANGIWNVGIATAGTLLYDAINKYYGL